MSRPTCFAPWRPMSMNGRRHVRAPHDFSDGDKQFVSYVLGLLAEEDAERLDEMSVADDRIAIDLRVVENDFVNAYVRGAMSDDTRERSSWRICPSPHVFRMVKFAEAFRSVTDRRERLWPTAIRMHRRVAVDGRPDFRRFYVAADTFICEYRRAGHRCL